MARALRYVPAGSLVEVTTRTIQSRLLLRPSRDLNEIIIGVIARAKRLYEVSVCALVYLSNHFHMLLQPADAQALADFMGYVNGNVAKEVNRLHGWEDHLWARRYQAVLVSDEEPDQVERLRYILEHGLKEDLVAKAGDWPGVHCVEALLHGRPLEGRWYDRSAEYEARRRRQPVAKHDYSTPEILILDPLPCWEGLPAGEIRARIAALVQEIDQETAARRRKEGRRVMGVERILKQDPYDVPTTTKRSPAPRLHASRREVWIAMQIAYREFRTAYRQAAEALRAGRRDVEFPRGSFPPRLPFVRGQPAFAMA